MISIASFLEQLQRSDGPLPTSPHAPQQPEGLRTPFQRPVYEQPPHNPATWNQPLHNAATSNQTPHNPKPTTPNSTPTQQSAEQLRQSPVINIAVTSNYGVCNPSGRTTPATYLGDEFANVFANVYSQSKF